MSHKILTVLGARPQFIKAASVSRAFSGSALEEIIIHTGQHYDKNMSDVFFEEMQIPKPHQNLDINSVGHGAMTGRMLEGIENMILEYKPSMLMVYGDTNSTIAGALAAKKLNVPVAHVEAGLRSFNMKMPEEINRILTDRISDLLFCPTDTAIQNLKKEGFDNFEGELIRTGDVMYDTAIFYSKISEERSKIVSELGLSSQPYSLATIHRQENTDDPARLSSILEALNTIHETNNLVVPLHPRTSKIIKKHGFEVKFMSIDPVGYLDMVQLIRNSNLVLTDSGGLQKEAFFFKKPCITMRDQTEWIELIENGFNVLVGASKEKVLLAFEKMIGSKINFDKDLYGKGDASKKIVNEIEKYLN